MRNLSLNLTEREKKMFFSISEQLNVSYINTTPIIIRYFLCNNNIILYLYKLNKCLWNMNSSYSIVRIENRKISDL